MQKQNKMKDNIKRPQILHSYHAPLSHYCIFFCSPSGIISIPCYLQIYLFILLLLLLLGKLAFLFDVLSGIDVQIDLALEKGRVGLYQLL